MTLEKLTQQPSKVEGSISWHLLLQPQIQITHIQIGSKSSNAPYALHLDRLGINLKIMPLLRGKLVFDTMNVDGFTALINVQETENQKSTHLNFPYRLERFLLSHGKITVNSGQQKITLTHLQIGGMPNEIKRNLFPVQLKGNLLITQAETPCFKTQFHFRGNTELSPAFFTNPLLYLVNKKWEGELSMKDTQLRSLRFNKLNAHIKTKPGVLILNPLTLRLYQGESVGQLRYEVASKRLLFNQTATNLDGSRFTYDLLHKDIAHGHLDFSIHADWNTNGNWQENITGFGSITLKNGHLKGLNLDNTIMQTSQGIRRLGQGLDQPLNFESNLFAKRTSFQDNLAFNLMNFSYFIQKGSLDSASLVLQTNALRLKGDVKINLLSKELESHLLAKITATDANTEPAQQMLGGYFPILIQGTLTAPKVGADLQIKEHG